MIRIVWSCIPRMPIRTKIHLLFKPMESTRYTEITYLYYFIKTNMVNLSQCLDISSPFILSYILSKKSKVIKTDIFPKERSFIRESENLKFEIQNALSLTYPDNSFDLVSSVSVIEHIYLGLQRSTKEMIRVAKPGGYIYISFPVSYIYQEEWLDKIIYSNQFIKDEKTFFQYRLDEKTLKLFLDSLKNVTIIKNEIYWEKSNGLYNKMILMLKNISGMSSIKFLINSLINLYYGFSLLEALPEGFEKAKDYGNISIILKKK